MKLARLRERMTLLGGTALLAVAILGAIARRQLRRSSWGRRAPEGGGERNREDEAPGGEQERSASDPP